MNETWLREALDSATTVPPGMRLDLQEAARDGLRERRRRHRTWTAGSAGAALCLTALTVGAVDLVHSAARPHTAVTLGAAADTTVQDEQSAAYFYTHQTNVQTAIIDGKASTRTTVESDWAGHRTAGLAVSDPPADGQPARTTRPVFADEGFSIPAEVTTVIPGSTAPLRTITPEVTAPQPRLAWDDMWTLPRTAQGLEDYYASHTPAGRTSDDVLFSWTSKLTQEPGPAALKLAAVDAIGALRGATTSAGSDALGRPATVVVYTRAHETDTLYFDPTTGQNLEFDIDGTVPGSPYTARTVTDAYGYTSDLSATPRP